MTMISVNEFKNGLTIQYNNDLWRIVEFQHVKPGKGSAFVRSKLKRLRTGAVVSVVTHEGETLGIQLPNTVDLKVAKTEPNIKGDTSSGGGKPATMETGLVVNVPFFINEGDVLTINTADGSYVSRANK